MMSGSDSPRDFTVNNDSWSIRMHSTGMPEASTSFYQPTYIDDTSIIKDVWAENLEEEFKTIRQVIQKYPYVAMDTEFPGVIARPKSCDMRRTTEYQYQLIRCNVDMLKIIQIGLTFFDEKGRKPEGCFNTWQFNFKFNISLDMYSEDSIQLLINSGIQFERHKTEGIEPCDFAELLMSSGVILMDNVTWTSFHSGYDFGYILKLLTNMDLPATQSEFFELLNLYFPTLFDIKYLMHLSTRLRGGLQDLAMRLNVNRIGRPHQAGSDSLLTGMVFFKMKKIFFQDSIDPKHSGRLFGLGSTAENDTSTSTNEEDSTSSLSKS